MHVRKQVYNCFWGRSALVCSPTRFVILKRDISRGGAYRSFLSEIPRVWKHQPACVVCQRVRRKRERQRGSCFLGSDSVRHNRLLSLYPSPATGVTFDMHSTRKGRALLMSGVTVNPSAFLETCRVEPVEYCVIVRT